MSFQVTRQNDSNSAYNNKCKTQVIIQKAMHNRGISPDVVDVLATCDYSIIFMNIITGLNLAEFFSMFGVHPMRKDVLTAIGKEVNRVLDILLANVSGWEPKLEHMMVDTHGKIYIINFKGCSQYRDTRNKADIIGILTSQKNSLVTHEDTTDGLVTRVANGFLPTSSYISVVSAQLLNSCVPDAKETVKIIEKTKVEDVKKTAKVENEKLVEIKLSDSSEHKISETTPLMIGTSSYGTNELRLRSVSRTEPSPEAKKVETKVKNPEPGIFQRIFGWMW